MGTPSRLSLLSMLLPAALMLGAAAPASAQDAHAGMKMPAAAQAPASGVAQARWSNPASWPDGKVPAAGDAVTIGKDRNILLDVTPPALRSLTIQGKLSFSDDKDLELKTEWIYLPGGELDIGSEAKPHTAKATITLTDNVKDENINTMGDRGIMMLNGTLSLHGDRKNAWTKLSATVKAGSTKIQVLDASGWRKGDVIVLASTDFNPRQAEERTITAISGNALTLDQPLKYMHFGKITDGVDERGEVGLLTRNILIHASDDAEKSYFGGHIMAMAGSKMYISGVELARMGQNMHLARYPVHWHVLGDGDGQYIENSAIHDTYSRCVTVHGTNNLSIKNNVTYNTVGHCFFMEDGIEHGNQFIRNLAIQTKCHPTLPCEPTNLGIPSERGPSGQKSDHVLIPSDNTAASFWITNPANSYIDNVAAGSDENGFWLSLPEHPTGAFKDAEISKSIWPRRTPMGEFRGNVAHSNYDGFMFDRNVAPDGTFGVTGTVYIPRKNVADNTSAPVENLFQDLTAYKNRNGGLWMRGEATLFRGLKMADNAIGMTFASGLGGGASFTSHTSDSLFVGESDNAGNPSTPAEIAYGRSLPKPQVPDFPVRGYEFYDLLHALSNVTFVNYQDNATRKTGAMSYLMFTSFGMSPENSVKGLKFTNAKPVYFPPREQRWASDFGTSAAFLTAAIHDLDGSTSGVPGAYIVYDNGIADDKEACVMKPEWGAAVCKGDYGRLSLGGGGLGRPGGPAGAGGPGGPGGAPRTGGAAAPAAPVESPVTLSRNGRTFDYRGQLTIRSGAEVAVDTARDSLPLRLSAKDGSWVVLKLNGFTAADKGAAQGSLAALRAASETSYYKDGDTLWLKLFAEKQAGGFNAPPTLTVSKGKALAVAGN
jgi:cell migration-inducing and hyaluronan-binding protein